MVDDSPPTSHAWARDDAERIAIEQILGGLTGRRLNAVRYVERLGYPPPHEPYWSGPLFDWIDDAIELDLDDGVTWRIEWEDGVGDNAGVRAHPADALLGADEQTAVWEVTDHWRAAGP